MSSKQKKLTSLLLVEERVLEAEYFADLMSGERDRERFGYCLNAFVSAARSVTFVMQKALSPVPGFAQWWSEQQQALGRDTAARFFLRLRNYSQKEGRISLVGIRKGQGPDRYWSYRFAGTVDRVPPELLNRDVVEVCDEHLAKLAGVVLSCIERFPFDSCPRLAITAEGVEALQLSMTELAVLAGLPGEWGSAASGIPYEHQLRILREQVDGLDIDELKRVSHKSRRNCSVNAGLGDKLGEEIAAGLVSQLEGVDRSVDLAALAAGLLGGSFISKADDRPHTEGSTNDAEGEGGP